MHPTLTFTPETTIDVTGSTTIDGVHLEDLSFVLDVEHEDGEIQRCTMDINELIRVTTLYASMEEQRYGWRR
ncbi:hypothetical protein [Haloferax sp. DFSO52]|uniref:hypothetical protein n=1 Tax=Haloferax sp. DFSO52 TaxID=3388505 RepID=UPI003A884419